MHAVKDFLSSCLLITSWLIFAVSSIFFFFSFLTVFAIPIFLLIFLTGLLCFHISKKLDSRRISKC
ncbi:hypothetical protein CN380_16830 [Bacillus sp. AFS017274]|nr:hypothetical protein CN380_16830 [Bacillus sp. AFS017274]